MLLNSCNATAVTILLPAAGRDLDIPDYNLQWPISAYSVSSGCFLILFGRLADLYGRKKVFLSGYAFMGLFALGCGFAQDEITLDVLRGIQGIGGAAVIPASVRILNFLSRSVLIRESVGRGPLGGTFGFVLGSVLVEVTKPTWRSLFFVCAGLALFGTVLGFIYIDPDQPSTEKDRRVDWIGAFFVTVGLVLVVFVLSDAPTATHGWKTNYIIALLVIGIAFVLVFLAWQRYLERLQNDPTRPSSAWAAPPLMKLSMWSRSKGRFAVMQFIAFINWCSFLCWMYWVQLYYQNFMHLSPIQTMLRILPTTVVGIACNVIVALVVGRVDVVYLIVLGTLLTGFANIFFALIDTSAPYWAFGFPSALIIVFGADFVFAAGTLFIAKISLPSEQSVAGALFMTMTQLGTAFGLSISTIVFNSVLQSEAAKYGIVVNKSGSNAPEAAQLKAYQAAEWTGFAFGITGTLLAILLRGVGIVGHNGPHGGEEPAFAEQENPSSSEIQLEKIPSEKGIDT
ncbi:hypothetical protein EWM64_g5920 [Hericium alpestre]|uniref:Major facilitator superfamily (MFS) profile domain-containing protein n=1 Tax=Hericium alpestre TaxID=135208 RepID=A0A4Y9ZTG6_9AGAM|nr:hypothetical protein EWM64_g5920 [Hericium alpestre]